MVPAGTGTQIVSGSGSAAGSGIICKRSDPVGLLYFSACLVCSATQWYSSAVQVLEQQLPGDFSPAR